MKVARFSDVDTFTLRCDNFLAEREAEHNLLLGIGARLRAEPRPYGHDPYLAVVEDGDRIVAAAIRTPPHNLVLSEIDDERACVALAEDVHAAFGSLSGVLGPVSRVEAFVRAWEVATGAHGSLDRSERIYQAETVARPEGVPGRMRWYAEGDRELAIEWLEAFMSEAELDEIESMTSWLERRLAEPEGGLVLWEDDAQVVSLAGFGGPTPNGIRVGPVYTPPERRGRGYASALVAELTSQQLDGGRRFCFLFTDLANPTSNSIYQRIGYRPVTDVDEWVFTGPGSA